MPRIHIQGWRLLPHSYSLVNEFQIFEMLRRPGVEIFHEDYPYHRPYWMPTHGLLDPEAEEIIKNLPPPPSDGLCDVTYRIGFPYDVSPSQKAKRTVVFGTSELHNVPLTYVVGETPIREAMSRSEVVIVTPSNWSREGFIRSGAPPERVVVVPHGIDPAIFHPLSPDERAERRRIAQCGDAFVFLNLGAMTRNKNLTLLLRAFGVVAEQYPHVRLALKGLDGVYNSRQHLAEAAQGMTQAQIDFIGSRLTYWGETVPMREIANIYQICDAYLSPYGGEGFNLPVLEAAACGMTVICTEGGSTDDFTTPTFALPIASKMVDVAPGKEDGGVREQVLIASLESMVAQMRRAVEDAEYRSRAREIGPAHVHENFSWKAVVDRLMPVLLSDQKNA